MDKRRERRGWLCTNMKVMSATSFGSSVRVFTWFSKAMSLFKRNICRNQGFAWPCLMTITTSDLTACRSKYSRSSSEPKLLSQSSFPYSFGTIYGVRLPSPTNSAPIRSCHNATCSFGMSFHSRTWTRRDLRLELAGSPFVDESLSF